MKKNIKIISIIFFISIIILFNHFFSVFKVFSDYMEPNIHKGSYILTVRKPKYKKGDIVVINWKDEILLRRIISLGGESIQIDKSGNVLINEEFLYEPYIQKKSQNPINISQPYHVAENSFFVMGDNRGKSYDSRYSKIKSINKNSVLGKVVFDLKP